jgi:ribosome-associated protein|nr:alternative ribosome rescue aminoacyl-tRNA hydrolase ArfB [Candidatus Krumholzibacteria bacterium]
MADDLVINDNLTIPDGELEITASRSSGPGGQHVNKTDTRIQVRWNVRESPVLSDYQRRLLMKNLSPRVTEAGDLLIASDSHRSQKRNRDDALQRLAALLREALIPPKPRKKTRPSRAAKEKRLQEKKQRSQVKQKRGKVQDSD